MIGLQSHVRALLVALGVAGVVNPALSGCGGHPPDASWPASSGVPVPEDDEAMVGEVSDGASSPASSADTGDTGDSSDSGGSGDDGDTGDESFSSDDSGDDGDFTIDLGEDDPGDWDPDD